MNALGRGGLPLPPALREAGDSMACNLVTAATFRQLQSRLLEDLRRAGAERVVAEVGGGSECFPGQSFAIRVKPGRFHHGVG